ncbi:sulfite exporter TauE/SafE family protein [Faecalibacter rhinopitheci]|uniref:Sulfite exporter TauE/SafE family protein n=1 Tax=Faecalibacter rhinopitheci TaxID=2779678 RepID=A0A8J7FT24_9FLAO|nr:sulfite exporter TauE/SafE family protein [Faecalibacter rhinopitheci]MBF0598408.1 sulfite exporter TauE/SafE family protein [Faecalibacter rhinopitheci]
MNITKLDQFEIENIEDVLPMFEETFKIKFENDETEKLNNFNEFSDLIISKMNLENDNLCTSQRAFYQFRNAIETEKIIARNVIKPETDLKTIFPKRNRRKIVKQIENQLGYKIEVLAPSQITINILLFAFIISFIGLFINWQIAILGILISVLGFYLTKFSNRLDKRTVREIIEKNTAQKYFKIRNSENSFNKNEFKDIILEWFSEKACINKEKLKNSTFA